MAFRKRFMRRKTYRKKARMGTKKIRKVVKSVINRSAETKVYNDTLFGVTPVIGVTGTVLSSENTIASGTTSARSLIYRELTLMGAQGTNDGQRIGAKVYMKKIVLKFSLQNTTGPSTGNNDPFTNAYVRFLLVTPKDDGDIPTLFSGSPGNGEVFFKRNGVTTNVYDSIHRLLDKPNPDILHVHKDMIIKLGPTATQVAGNSPNETCSAYKRIVIPFNKTMNYVGTGTNFPQNHRMIAVWFCSRADGTVGTINKVTVNVNAQHDIYYTDV